MTLSDAILNTRQAAELMGSHIETIRRLARKGAIPAFKVGKDWRYRRKALLNWAENSTKTQSRSHVLVVDDDAAICKQIRRILESGGWRVHTAHNGLDGLAYACTEPIFLVLLDLKMPVMNGTEFLIEFRKSEPDVPVILITGYPDSQLILEAMVHTPLLLLAKPIVRRRLLSSVRAVLSQPYRENRQYGETVL